jgi:hypothetical protein
MTDDTTPKDVVVTLPLDGTYTITMPPLTKVPFSFNADPDGRVFVELFGDDDAV